MLSSRNSLRLAEPIHASLAPPSLQRLDGKITICQPSPVSSILAECHRRHRGRNQECDEAAAAKSIAAVATATATQSVPSTAAEAEAAETAASEAAAAAPGRAFVFGGAAAAAVWPHRGFGLALRRRPGSAAAARGLLVGGPGGEADLATAAVAASDRSGGGRGLEAEKGRRSTYIVRSTIGAYRNTARHKRLARILLHTYMRYIFRKPS